MGRQQKNWCNGKMLYPAGIKVDSLEWYAWLNDEQNRSFSYQSDPYQCIVRCEQQNQRWYWYAYKRQLTEDHRLKKVYLGSSEHLTSDVLADAAKKLFTQRADERNPDQVYLVTRDAVEETLRDINKLQQLFHEKGRLRRSDIEYLLKVADESLSDLRLARIRESVDML